MSPKGEKPKTEREANKRIEKRSTPKRVSKVIFDLDDYFDFFVSVAESWEKGLSEEDYAQLIARVINHLENVPHGMEVAEC